jgi:hypothetical protein
VVPALIWDTGIDASLLSAIALTVAFSIGAFMLRRQLRAQVTTLATRPSQLPGS